MKILIYAIVLFNFSVCLAAFSNPNSLALGDRSSGMGGAATALTGDVSSAAYYNPAVLARTLGQSFSAAAGVYKKFDTVYGADTDYTKTPLRVSTGYFRSIPASTGNIITIKDYKVGMSIVVPDYDTFKGDLKNTSTSTSTLSYTDESLWVGGAISKNISADSSVGLSLYYTARNFQRSIQDKAYNPSLDKLFTSEETLQQNDIVAVFGYFQKLSPSLSIGASLRPKGINFASKATYFEDKIDIAGATQSRINENNLTSTSFIPGRAALGLSWELEDGWVITSDISVTEGYSFKSFDYLDRGTQLIYKATWNAAVGIEKEFRDWLHFRTGFFSNYSAHPNPNPQILSLQGERVDQAGYSANLNFTSGKKIHYTFGGYWIGGRGRAVTRTDQVYAVTTKVQNVFTMLVATSFFF